MPILGGRHTPRHLAPKSPARGYLLPRPGLTLIVAVSWRRHYGTGKLHRPVGGFRSILRDGSGSAWTVRFSVPKKALAEIWGAEDKQHTLAAVKAGAK